MKIHYLLLFSMLFLVSCSDGTQPSPTSSDFDLSTVEGKCRYAMKLAENDPQADPEYIRSITDKTCTTTGGTLDEWQCLIDKVKGGTSFDQADLDCFKNH